MNPLIVALARLFPREIHEAPSLRIALDYGGTGNEEAVSSILGSDLFLDVVFDPNGLPLSNVVSDPKNAGRNLAKAFSLSDDRVYETEGAIFTALGLFAGSYGKEEPKRALALLGHVGEKEIERLESRIKMHYHGFQGPASLAKATRYAGLSLAYRLMLGKDPFDDVCLLLRCLCQKRRFAEAKDLFFDAIAATERCREGLEICLLIEEEGLQAKELDLVTLGHDIAKKMYARIDSPTYWDELLLNGCLSCLSLVYLALGDKQTGLEKASKVHDYFINPEDPDRYFRIWHEGEGPRGSVYAPRTDIQLCLALLKDSRGEDITDPICGFKADAWYFGTWHVLGMSYSPDEYYWRVALMLALFGYRDGLYDFDRKEMNRFDETMGYQPERFHLTRYRMYRGFAMDLRKNGEDFLAELSIARYALEDGNVAFPGTFDNELREDDAFRKELFESCERDIESEAKEVTKECLKTQRLAVALHQYDPKRYDVHWLWGICSHLYESGQAKGKDLRLLVKPLLASYEEDPDFVAATLHELGEIGLSRYAKFSTNEEAFRLLVSRDWKK